mmetsp:Transcript_28115/g.49557  ORF Transcript_28115/g.49557 Transcript_28115/m.49557 type:complete len:438 (+) Transcript_28115:155-1468(+)|eukprot:CAMPEP_0197517344 /NCGR_PEP_ID=MMETSP1318-20131121/2325_1 /TAXON_ID=552666 /ORGANISM="Partenskyella glossopodia, Strain RCC365" /LENGTH=437 /DNA_ID=CAMNT_0043066813 /DNA_START=101 /DNA_END=1414 /DNA_ORIENTATION=-
MNAALGTEKMESVFVCQKCQAPLKIVERKGVKDSTLAELQSKDLPSYLDESYRKKEAEAIKLLGESFVVLKDNKANAENREGPGGGKDFHAQVQALTKVFEVVSDKVQVDTPLCNECNFDIIKKLQDKIKDIKEECKIFRTCIKNIKKEQAERQTDPKKQREEEQREKKVAKEVEAQMAEIQKQRLRLNAETQKLEAESERLMEFESKFWQEYQDFQIELAGLEESREAVESNVEMTKRQLKQLKCTNVYDDAFHISTKGHFGSINGFKLGRLPAQSVGWDEINAALGQVVLLLHCISKQINYDLKSVVLHPMGSYSKIADSRNPSVLNELYNYSSSEFFLRQGSSSSSAGKRFNTALSLLLRAVKELGDFASSRDPSFELKKSIKGDEIEGKSIQAVAAEVDWTKALKYMLIDVKWLLAWSQRYTASGKVQRNPHR